MPADPVLLADVRSWLIKAANDLRGARDCAARVYQASLASATS